MFDPKQESAFAHGFKLLFSHPFALGISILSFSLGGALAMLKLSVAVLSPPPTVMASFSSYDSSPSLTTAQLFKLTQSQCWFILLCQAVT